MKKLLFYVVMGSLILMLGCSENSPLLPGDEPVQQESLKKSAKKPMAKIVGYTVERGYPNPAMYSVGTIEIEGMGTYGIIYHLHLDEIIMRENANAWFLTETFYIKEMGDYIWDTTDPTFNFEVVDGLDYLMTGTNSGVVANNKIFKTNGSVTDANGEWWEGWIGRNVHVDGKLGDPITSKFQVN